MFLQEPERISQWIFLRCLLFCLNPLPYSQTVLGKTIICFTFRDFGRLSVGNQDLCFSFQFLIALRQRSALMHFIYTFLLLSVIPILLFLIKTLSLCQAISRIEPQERGSSWNHLPHATVRQTGNQKLPIRQFSKPHVHARSKEKNGCINSERSS